MAAMDRRYQSDEMGQIDSGGRIRMGEVLLKKAHKVTMIDFQMSKLT
jgi:hypothetical protein